MQSQHLVQSGYWRLDAPECEGGWCAVSTPNTKRLLAVRKAVGQILADTKRLEDT